MSTLNMCLKALLPRHTHFVTAPVCSSFMPLCNLWASPLQAGSPGSELIAETITTGVPDEVMHPDGHNSFAIGDAKAMEDSTFTKRLSVDVEAQPERNGLDIDYEKYPLPTPEEVATLRKVPDSIPAAAYTLCIVELAERASYYGVQTVFSNFMQFPLPKGGNGAGAPAPGTEDTAGALDMGEQFSVAIGLLFLFLAYAIPIFGGYIADTKLGRLKTILIGVLICGVSHVIMICGAIPWVLQAGHGMVPFMISLILLAIGVGIFKPSIAPIVMDQYEHQRPYTKVLASGEKVLVDPEATIQRIMLTFYAMVNVGAFFAIATTYSEKVVGYWLAFLTSGIIYFLLPLLLWSLRKRMTKRSPGGTAISEVWKIGTVAIRESKGKLWKADFWDAARPSNLKARGITTFRGKDISWNNKAVSDVQRLFQACAIFMYFPIYNINDGGVGTVATSQGAAMTTRGAPNDLLVNSNPLCIIVFIPFLNYVVYPFFRKHNIKFGRISRLTFGFSLAVLSGIVGAIIQYKIYQTSPCGYYASDCDIGSGVSPISVWAQLPEFVLGAMSECFCNVTAYEIAYARAPKGMKALVMALFLFTVALSYALGEILIPAVNDPHLIWVWAVPAIALAVQTIIFWCRYRSLNEDEFMTYDEDFEDDSNNFCEDHAKTASIAATVSEEGSLSEKACPAYTPQDPPALDETKA